MTTPEQQAREHIDEALRQAGWVIQDFSRLNPAAGVGVAIREFPLKKGQADYLLIVNRKAVGVIEAKPVGATLGGVDWQSEKYINNLPGFVQFDFDPLPYVYESTGVETLFRKETERFRAFSNEELTGRDKASLDIFWLKDESLEDTQTLPEPDIIAAEIVENLGAALALFGAIEEELDA